MNEKTIEELHYREAGKVRDKWSSYLPFYDSLLKDVRQTTKSILEIGIEGGGSLESWGAYFPNAEKIIGCDINEKCRQLVFEDKRISVEVGDANDLRVLEAITRASADFDIIIDDASHVSANILRSFVLYFPMLKPGGIYVVEDCHTLYWGDFGGGILNELSAYAFFKKLVDVVNFQFWSTQLSINTYLGTFFHPNQLPGFIADGWIDAVEFRNSLIVIRKSLKGGHDKLGERIIAGAGQVRRGPPGYFGPMSI